MVEQALAPDDSRPVKNLEELGLLEFLEQDSRATFITDLDDEKRRPSFVNNSLRLDPLLLAAVSGHSAAYFTGATWNDFKDWVRGKAGTPSRFSFAGTVWTRTTLRHRWQVVQADGHKEKAKEGIVASALHLHTASANSSRRSSVVSKASSNVPSDMPAQRAVKAAEPIRRDVELASGVWGDVTQPPGPGASPQMQLLWSIDWSETSLGPIQSWPASLKTALQIVMRNPKPTSLIWGKDKIMLYNEAYVEICGEKHPMAFGASFWDVYPEVSNFEKLFEQAERTRQGISCRDCLYFISRHGFIEETYFSFSLMPLYEGNECLGFYNPTWETTLQVVGLRRMDTIFSIARATAAPKSVAQFWSNTVSCMSVNENDFPFASVYSVNVANDTSSVLPSGELPNVRHCKFEGATPFVPAGHTLATPSFDLEKDGGIAIVMKRVAKTGEPILLRTSDGTLDESITQGLRCPPFGDTCNAIVVCPVKHTSGTFNVRGFAIIGLNPRLPYDRSYSRFIDLLMQHFGTCLASGILLEEELRKAAVEQAQLEEELQKTNVKAQKAAMQFEQFADSAPIGINVFDVEGKILYANDMWFEVTQVSRTASDPSEWMASFVPEELEKIGGIWSELAVDKKAVTFEGRLRRPWRAPGGQDGEGLPYTWIWASAYPDLNPDGSIRVIVGCFKDISQQKYVEEIQTRRMNDALEAKRLQESFIDMTSHELRNPLSAVVHAADGIISLLSKDLESPVEPSQLSFDAVASSLEAAKSIVHCSLHQKRIADDILTASKLDSNLLPVSPDCVKLREVVENTLRMFDGELRSASIDYELSLDKSIEELNIGWVYVDPSRLTQIFVNLLANAIKFTQAEERKKITVRVGASLQRHMETFSVRYVPPMDTKQPSRDPTTEPEWGSGEVVYLHFAIEDTGRGLTDSECDHLFRRFSQANPRTHVQYGGSGLGLFISRELTELQGGEIGVASVPGVGSKFAFYIKSRRAVPPVEETLAPPKRAAAMRRRTSSNLSRSNHVGSVNGLASQPMPPPSLATNLAAFAGNKRASAATKAKRTDGFTVLYVEDNLVNRKVLSKQLRTLGFIVYEANHGEEALAFLKETKLWDETVAQLANVSLDGNIEDKSASSATNGASNGNSASLVVSPPSPPLSPPPGTALPVGSSVEKKDIHVILMDLEMPIMDGLTCMRHIRRLQTDGCLKSHVPTIAVTANARREQVAGALEAGMDAVVSKPFRLPELVRRMEELVEAGSYSAAAGG